MPLSGLTEISGFGCAAAPDPSKAERLVSDVERTKTNFERLLEHLREGSLAAQFVIAHLNRGAKTTPSALREVLQNRFAALKQPYAEDADK